MTDQEFDVLFEKLGKIADTLGVKKSSWSVEEPKDLDFSKVFSETPLKYTNKRQSNRVYTLKAPVTYGDIWKVFEKSLLRMDDHAFIEGFEKTGTDTLIIHTGS